MINKKISPTQSNQITDAPITQSERNNVDLKNQYCEMAKDLRNNAALQKEFMTWDHLAGEGLNKEIW